MKPGEPIVYTSYGPLDPKMQYLYRYVDRYTHYYEGPTVVTIYCFAYLIISETEKGYWIKTSDSYWPRNEVPKHCKKFVLKYGASDRAGRFKLLRRWAYSSVEDAWKSFKIRKFRQREHLEDQLQHVTRVEGLIDKGEFESRHARVLTLAEDIY